MRIQTDHGDEENVDLINLTPLLDIVFNLIIFFMVTTQFQEDERDLKINLPDAESAQAAAKVPQTLLINIGQDGRFKVGDRVMDKDEVKKTLQKAKRENPSQKVVMRVDKDTPFRHPVVIIDICKGLGIETSIATMGPEAR